VRLLVHTPQLISEHELLSASEAKKIVKKYNAPLEKFPKILESDPQAKKLNAKPGSMIVIHREDPTGSYSYYRLVVKG
jgi:DNA-directed RNA polymerase subunit H